MCINSNTNYQCFSYLQMTILFLQAQLQHHTQVLLGNSCKNMKYQYMYFAIHGLITVFSNVLKMCLFLLVDGTDFSNAEKIDTVFSGI